ncbi:hypothetical protein LARV_02225 [Longilinea arvoryzae]|uniref:Uncharacterized protein n=1 Tax=Longilinea arvoryzae TaxID=360412 RepID=A0A0S7BJH1_9CHLR|nr:hypothetical protein LARV_02225 [Longilinea arvoryzae]
MNPGSGIFPGVFLTGKNPPGLVETNLHLRPISGVTTFALEKILYIG